MIDNQDLHSVDVPLHHCPSCGHELDAITAVIGEPEPTPGGVTICVYCLAVNTIGPDLTPQLPTPQELAMYRRDPDVIRALGLVRTMGRTFFE